MLKSQWSNVDTESHQPVWLVRKIAGISISIRQKLLVSFVGMTLLMAGLAVIGLETLKQANARTDQLLKDQERIAFFNEAYAYLSNLIAIAAAIPIDPADVDDKTINRIFVNPGFLISGVSNNFLLHTGHGFRNFGLPAMPDVELIGRLRAEAKFLDGIAMRAAKARREGDYMAAGAIARREFAPIAVRLQGDVYSKVKEIEGEMVKAAESTALAYQASRQLVVGSALVAVGVALLLGYVISSSLIWPVRRIGQTLNTVAQGGFDARVSVPNQDELGELAQKVNATSEQLGELYKKVESQRAELATEHARSEALLYNLLPRDIATRLKLEPDITIADRIPQVAILFADIVDFSPRAAALPPEELVRFLNKIFSSFDELAEKHGLEKIKTIGDAYMVAAGMPSPVGNPVHRVAEMALDMQSTVSEMSSEFPEGLKVRVGLHAGAAVAGVIGNQKLFYDVWGETVNTASRMESHGEPGRVQVTTTVKEELEQDYHFTPRGTVHVKGVGDVETWWLTGKRTAN